MALLRCGSWGVGSQFAVGSVTRPACVVALQPHGGQPLRRNCSPLAAGTHAAAAATRIGGAAQELGQRRGRAARACRALSRPLPLLRRPQRLDHCAYHDFRASSRLLSVQCGPSTWKKTPPQCVKG
jgi:hypothetical protein